jgi:hypothetical protein
VSEENARRVDVQEVTHSALVADAAKWKARFDNLLRSLVLLILIAATVTTYFTVVTLSEVRDLGKQNISLNKITVENSKRLIDCTTPGYGCYERSRAATGKAVFSLNQVTKAAVICADQPGVITTPEMERCITTEIKKQGELP